MQNDSQQVGALTRGTVFQRRYEIVRCIKSGGMGSVYEVAHLETSRRLALKTMLPEIVADKDLRERFRLEARITANVRSDHIVQVFDAGIDEPTGLPFLVMELLEGEDLEARLSRGGRLPAAEVVYFLHQASLALDRTHAESIVHRDLKPANLFVTRRDSGVPHLKLLDFGIAKLVAESTRAKTTATVGTPLYMAPEQAAGEATIGPAADLYAVGHIAFTLLVGEAFWEEAARKVPSAAVLLVKVMQGPTEKASARAAALGVSLSEGFDAWFANATALLPRDRFATASEAIEALSEVLGVALPRDSHPEFSMRERSEAPSKMSRQAAGTFRLGTPASLLAARPDEHGAHGIRDTGVAVSSDQRDSGSKPSRRMVTALAALAALGVAAGLIFFPARQEPAHAPVAVSNAVETPAPVERTVPPVNETQTTAAPEPVPPRGTQYTPAAKQSSTPNVALPVRGVPKPSAHPKPHTTPSLGPARDALPRPHDPSDVF